MSKLQKCTLLKHAMVTADNTKQFILRGCNENIKRGSRRSPDWPIHIHNGKRQSVQQAAYIHVPCCTLPWYRDVHEAAGVVPQPEQGLTLEELWQDKTGMFAVEALELFAPCSYGSVLPTSGSSCRLRYKSKSRFPLADLHFTEFTMARKGKPRKYGFNTTCRPCIHLNLAQRLKSL